jgi:hypothetical protein
MRPAKYTGTSRPRCDRHACIAGCKGLLPCNDTLWQDRGPQRDQRKRSTHVHCLCAEPRFPLARQEPIAPLSARSLSSKCLCESCRVPSHTSDTGIDDILLISRRPKAQYELMTGRCDPRFMQGSRRVVFFPPATRTERLHHQSSTASKRWDFLRLTNKKYDTTRAVGRVRRDQRVAFRSSWMTVGSVSHFPRQITRTGTSLSLSSCFLLSELGAALS